MNTLRRHRISVASGLFVAISVLVLLVSLFYTYAAAFLAPYPGFDLRPDWTIESLEPCEVKPAWCQANQNTLQVSDQVLVIGDLTYDEFRRDRSRVAFDGYEPGKLVSITFRRAGEVRTVNWQMLGPTIARSLNRLSSLLIYLPFWLAGTLILLLLRPRDLRWRLLILFNYVTAIWAATGTISYLTAAYSSLLLHTLTWLLVPIYLHLHLTIPSPIWGRYQRYFLPPIYVIATLLAIFELFQILPSAAFNLGLLLAILGSFGLLVFRLVSNPTAADRIAIRLILIGIGVAFGPGIALTLIPSLLRVSTGSLGLNVAAFAIPLLPLFYIYAIYKHRLGNLEFRANRLLSLYSFALLYATTFVLVFSIGSQWLNASAQSLTFSLVVSMVFVIGALPLRTRFQRLVDQLVYGAKHDPDEIIRIFANRIQSVLDREALVQLLTREVAPSLLIRESALYLLSDTEYSLFYADGISLDDKRESLPATQQLLAQAGRYQPPEVKAQGDFDWVRLVIVLKVREKTLGAWLLGRRDPDDFYPQPDIALLSTLANQIATALENMRLFEDTRVRARQLALLYDTGLALNSVLEPRTQLESLFNTAIQALRADRAEFFHLDPARNEMVFELGLGYHPETPATLREARFAIGEERGLVGRVGKHRVPLNLPDVLTDPRYIILDPEIRSALWVPVEHDKQLLGILAVLSTRVNAFGPQDERLLVLIANQAAVALENARLVEETKHRAKEMGALVELNRSVTEGVGLQETLDRILRSALKIIPVSECSVTLLDEPSGDLVVQASTNGGIGLRINPAEPSAVGWVVQTKQILAEEEASANPIFDQELVQRYRIKSALIVPIIYKDKAVGTLGFSECESPRTFSEGERMAAQAFALQAAIAIENARLYGERDRKIRELTALNKIATSITSTLDLERLLDLTMQEVKDVLGVAVCSLMLLDEQTQELVFKVSLGPGAEQAKQIRLGLNRGIAGWVAREGKPDLVLHVRTDPRWYPEIDSRTGFDTRSILAVPLKSKEKVIGVIEAINKVQGAFTADDLQLLNSISMVVTTAIENARLFGELNTAYQEMATSHAQILESRNILRALFDGINDSICIIGQDLQIKAINRTAAAVVREEPQNLIGRNCHTVLCEPNVLCDDCPINATFRTGKPTLKTERHIGKLAATRKLEIGTYPMKDTAGIVDRVIYIAQDVTEKRKMEAILLQSARLSAVGQLAAGVTHEIGNPLTAVIGNAQMLLERLEPGDPRYRMAQLIERAGMRMERVVSNLLNFSRQEEYQFAPTDLNASIEDALALLGYQLERDNIQVTKEFQANLPVISASASHLQTVWTNLLLNARDAIPKGKTGQIQITTCTSEDRRSVKALFTDNGSGIDAETLAKIFDPFFTTKPRGKGTGLGLYIGQTIIAHHDGTIHVQSQVGKGSMFVVTLPRESEAEPDDAEPFAA